MVGASGAISGVLGAYLLLYPRVRVRVLVVWFLLSLPAYLVLLSWIGLQALFSALTVRMCVAELLPLGHQRR